MKKLLVGIVLPVLLYTNAWCQDSWILWGHLTIAQDGIFLLYHPEASWMTAGWFIREAFSTYEGCKQEERIFPAAVRQAYEDIGTKATGVGNMVGYKDKDGVSILYRFQCFPSNFDPREAEKK